MLASFSGSGPSASALGSSLRHRQHSPTHASVSRTQIPPSSPVFASLSIANLVPFLGYQLPCCYLLKECLGTSYSGGQLWVATKTADGTSVILKILIPGVVSGSTSTLSPQFATSEDEAMVQRSVQRAKNEAVMLRHLPPHPFIVDFVEQFAAEDVIVTVTKRVEGRHLGEQLQSMKNTGRRFTEAEACVLIAQLLLALKHCHGKGVVHRDVRLSNIFLHTSGLLRLGDFDRAKWDKCNITAWVTSASRNEAKVSCSIHQALAVQASDAPSLMAFPPLLPVASSAVFSTSVANVDDDDRRPNNRPGCNVWCRRGDDLLHALNMLGDTGRKVTPYIAPELLLPEGTCTPKSDVWAAGVVLFQVVTGTPPFAGRSQAEMRMSIARGLQGRAWEGLSHRTKYVLLGMLNPCIACRWDATTALRSKYLQSSLRALQLAVRPHHEQVAAEMGETIRGYIDACIDGPLLDATD